MRTLLLVFASIFAASTAHADDVGVVVTGEATLQPQLVSSLEGWLRDRGRQVVPSPLEPDAINTLVDCFVLEDMGCARGVIDKRSKAKAVVYARVEVTQNAEDGSRDISIAAYWFQKDHDALAERRTCSHCGEAEMHAAADEVMAALVHLPPPSSATAPPVTGPTAPATGPATTEGQRSKLVPLGLVGIGAVALVAGGVMIAIDQDVSPTGVQAPSYRDTATGGVILGLAGVAAIGAGVYLWFHDRHHSVPVAAVSHDGAVVGWAGRF